MTKTVRGNWVEAQQRISELLALGDSEAGFEARILLQASLNRDQTWLIGHENDAMEANIHVAFEALLKHRLNGEPIAYILGKREFYGLEFIVTPDTLIPRPDTETLVDAALKQIPPDKRCKVLDLGTGTGAIAIAIASQRPQAEVTAADASLAALAVAQVNARNLNMGNVQFMLSDWFGALQNQTFDVIASNPPYIAENDAHLSQGDLRFEPRAALVSGEDGLNDVRKIIQTAPQHLKPQSWLLLEHGYDQAEKVAVLMKNSGFKSIASIADLAGIMRVTMCQYLP